MKHDSINFVARFYRKNSFDVQKGWHSLGLVRVGRFRWLRIAACVAVVAALGVSAMIFISRSAKQEDAPKVEPEKPEVTTPVEKEVAPEIHVIDMENAPLPDVIEMIEQTYHVEVTNRPENSRALRLTLHFTGTAGELIESINEIYGLELHLAE